MRVCYFGTYDRDYTRNRIIIDGLREIGVEVVECHRPFWQGTADKIARAAGGWKRIGFLARLAATYLRLAADFVRLRHRGPVIVGYAGLLDVYPAWLLTRWPRRPLLLDAYLSVYNSIVHERRLCAPGSLKARVVRAVERRACLLADRVLLDTQAHVGLFCELHGLDAGRFAGVLMGADERVFRPAAGAPAGGQDGLFRVIGHGKYIQTAGVEHAVRAAALLAGEAGVVFEFVGEGEGKAAAQELAASLGLSNVEWTGWLEKEELVRRLHGADVCLGNFGATPQARCAISNKVIEGLGAGLAVLAGDTPANREAVRHGETAWLCPVADPPALAGALRELRADPALRARLAAAGSAHFQAHYTRAAMGRRVRAVLEEAAARRGR